MTKTFTLTIADRLTALSILGPFKGNADELAFCMDDAKLLSIDEVLAKEINLVKKDNMVIWDAKIAEGKDKEVKLYPSTVAFILKAYKEKNDAKNLGIEDSSLIALAKKIQ